MADELQSLLEKINAEGVKKAEAERSEIIAAANAEAQKIVSGARAEAEKIIAEAESESSALRSRAESAVKQAARDAVLELKAELEARLNDAVKDAAAKALSPELMARIVRELALKFADSPDAELSVRCAVKDREELDKALRDALAESLKKAPKLLPDRALSGGLEVGFRDGELYFDFSLEAVEEVVSAYVGERMAELFRGK